MHSFVKILFLSTALALTGCSDGSQVFSSTASGSAKQSQSGAGYYKVGNPYQVSGVWYYPKEDYNYKEIGVSSWYGPDFHNGITANGELYDMHGLTAAHRTLPLPSVVRVTNLQNGRSLVLRVNDRGPFVNDRIIDVSMRAAQLLGFKDQGTTQVQVEILPEESKTLRDELLAGGTGTSSDAAAAASAAALESPEYAAEPVARPKQLGGNYSPNYPRLANPPPALAATDAPLISAPSEVKVTEYNDWDNDLSKNQAQKAYNEPAPAAKKAAPAPAKKAATPKKAAAAGAGTATSAAVVSSGPIAPGYYVQVGAFGNLENAEKMRSRVSGYGSTVVLPVSVNGKTLYRVRLGPDNAKKALEIMDRVTSAGISDARLVEENGPSAGKRLDSAF